MCTRICLAPTHPFHIFRVIQMKCLLLGVCVCVLVCIATGEVRCNRDDPKATIISDSILTFKLWINRMYLSGMVARARVTLHPQSRINLKIQLPPSREIHTTFGAPILKPIVQNSYWMEWNRTTTTSSHKKKSVFIVYSFYSSIYQCVINISGWDICGRVYLQSRCMWSKCVLAKIHHKSKCLVAE